MTNPKTMLLSVLILASGIAFANEVDITGVDKGVLIQALYTNAQPQGFGFLQNYTAEELSKEQIEGVLSRGTNGGFVDYINGRVMKISIGYNSTSFDPWLYDRDNGGPGTAEAIVSNLRNNS